MEKSHEVILNAFGFEKKLMITRKTKYLRFPILARLVPNWEAIEFEREDMESRILYLKRIWMRDGTFEEINRKMPQSDPPEVQG